MTLEPNQVHRQAAPALRRTHGSLFCWRDRAREVDCFLVDIGGRLELIVIACLPGNFRGAFTICWRRLSCDTGSSRKRTALGRIILRVSSHARFRGKTAAVAPIDLSNNFAIMR